MGKLFIFVVVVGVMIGLAMPGSKPTSGGNPHRITTPSEPPHETQLERTSGGRFFTYAKVNGELARFVVDTGADVVALTTDLPDKGLARGQVGTVVEILGADAYEIEFSDDSGHTYAQLPLRGDQLLVLHYEPQSV